MSILASTSNIIIDISRSPDVLDITNELAAGGEPRVLRGGHRRLVVVTPYIDESAASKTVIVPLEADQYSLTLGVDRQPGLTYRAHVASIEDAGTISGVLLPPTVVDVEQRRVYELQHRNHP